MKRMTRKYKVVKAPSKTILAAVEKFGTDTTLHWLRIGILALTYPDLEKKMTQKEMRVINGLVKQMRADLVWLEKLED